MDILHHHKKCFRFSSPLGPRNDLKTTFVGFEFIRYDTPMTVSPGRRPALDRIHITMCLWRGLSYGKDIGMDPTPTPYIHRQISGSGHCLFPIPRHLLRDVTPYARLRHKSRRTLEFHVLRVIDKAVKARRRPGPMAGHVRESSLRGTPQLPLRRST